jgi:hypothetical protein
MKAILKKDITVTSYSDKTLVPKGTEVRIVLDRGVNGYYRVATEEGLAFTAYENELAFLCQECGKVCGR